MRLLRLISFVLLFFSQVAGVCAQDTTMFVYPKHQIKFSPLKLIDPFAPGIEIGYERRLNKYFSVHGATAILVRTGISTLEKISGYRFLGELKYLDPTHELGHYFYPSLCVAYNNMNATTTRYFTDTFYNLPKQYEYLDTFSLHSKTFVVNLNFTLIEPFRSHFIFEFTGGLGVKFSDVVHYDRINPNHWLKHGRSPITATSPFDEGVHARLNIMLAVKLCNAF